MSESETQLPDAGQSPQPSRLRRFFLRHVPLGIGGVLVLVTLVVVSLYLWMSSAQFEGIVLRRLVAEIEQSTGGRAQIASFHWRLLHLEADADGLVIHGREGPGEAPDLVLEQRAARRALRRLHS